MTPGFPDWSRAIYARTGAEPLLLRLQDAHGLNVNMLLWCLWCGTAFREPPEIVLRKAIDLSSRWTLAATAPLRSVRRNLKTPPRQAPPDAARRLRDSVKAVELAAEDIEQRMLEALAREDLAPAEEAGGAGRARRNLAAYVRLADAARTPGFSVSLLESLIELTFPPSESDGESA
ncbi:MAG: TIGR02444 family protein [Parvularculaceae bacterium]|nr:TIGR02444 family protein [Parvularculaceae bacterium]